MDLTTITGFEAGSDAAASGGAVVTGGASANTKGAWTELIAAAAADAAWLYVVFGSGGSAHKALLDVGLGAAGSEQVLVPDLHYDCIAGGMHNETYALPVAIPAGSRVAVRVQSTVGSGAVRATALLGQGPDEGLATVGEVYAYGVSTADSGLTAVDPGAAANADGAWVQLTAATTAAIRWLVLAVGHDADTLASGTRWLVDVGTGAGGAEAVLVPDVAVSAGQNSDIVGPRAIGFPVDIPAGTRIAARARCTTTRSPDRLLDVAVYGVDAPEPTGGAGGAHAFASWG